MRGHCLRHRPYIKQHMSAGRVAHRKRLRYRPPHLTGTCVRVELVVSQRRRQRANIEKTFFEKLMNIQYLNLPPYPNRWMVWLIQHGLAVSRLATRRMPVRHTRLKTAENCAKEKTKTKPDIIGRMFNQHLYITIQYHITK